MKRIKFISIFLLMTPFCFGQNGHNSYKFWNQRSLQGAVGIRGEYRKQHQVLGSGFEENLNGSLYAARFLLESKSYIVHPNLMDLGIGIEYNPEKVNDQYMISPDRSEVRNLARLNINSTFFKEKDVTVNGFINLNKSYITRENLTNVKTNRKFYGGGVFYKNVVLPVSITYQEGSWDQKEISTEREYSYWQRNIKGMITKSFFGKDKQRFTYSYDDFIREEYYTTPRRSIINDVKFNSNVFLDKENKYNTNTIISNFNQRGTNEFNRFQILATLRMELPRNFNLNGNYTFYDQQYPLYRLDQNKIKLNIGHQLFKSLRTSLYSEYAHNNHTIYKEDDLRSGLNIRYTKKIPTGQLNISYTYFNRNYKTESDAEILMVTDEQHVLSDGQITLLDNSYIETGTIVVKDVTGTIVYQLNLDYVIIEQNNYIEIQRIPGGQIPNNSTILVDYSALLHGSYKYTLDNHSFRINLLLFKRLVEIYYHREKQDYKNLVTTEFVTLNYYSQNIYGIRLTKGIAQIGVEYDNYNSTIIPYQLIHYYANLNWKYRNKLLISLFGNVNNYLKIGDRKDELYADVSAKMAYSFSKRLKLNMEVAYRDQRGYQIDLDLLTARTELTMMVRNLSFTVGVDVYRRNYLDSETLDFNGVYASIERKF